MMLDQRFENHSKKRYYRLILAQDLFGDWVVTRVWGGIGRANGRIMHVSCGSYEDAVKLFNFISKARIKKGYGLCRGQK